MKTVRARYKSNGGVHPAHFKQLTAEKPVEALPLPALFTVSMAQHMGAPARPTVKKGDKVLRGQLIGEPAGFISAAVHAPTSGEATAVDGVPTASGAIAQAVSIEPDGEDRLDAACGPTADWELLDAKKLVGIVADAGIAGMGGAGFPTHVKLSPPPNTPIDTLIVNGAECEPYLTADYRLMMESAESVRGGIEIIRKILGAGSVRVAIEDNKPAAIKAMQAAISGLEGDVQIVVLETEYPQGAEKQQIFAVTGREVPSGGLPMDVGVLVENVGTAAAIWNAVAHGMPLIERIATVTGNSLQKPSNLKVRIGTPFSELLAYCGGMPSDSCKLICGGPMMGLALGSQATAVTKTTSGLLLLSERESTVFTSSPCISCGRCVGACPMNLMPNELSQFLEAEDYEFAEQYDVLDCMECGCCAFVCPARRPLVQHMRSGKAVVALRKRERQQQAEKKQ